MPERRPTIPGVASTTTATPRSSTTPPERPPCGPPRPTSPAPSDALAPAERVRVTDRPASQGGRAYLVERGLDTKSELDALIADYLHQATKLDSPPLAIRPLEADA